MAGDYLGAYTGEQVDEAIGKVLRGEIGGGSGDVGPQGPPGPEGEPGIGVPAGGTAGQMLTKKADEDYDTQWADPPEGGGEIGGVTMEQVNAAIQEAISNIPGGVTMEQVNAAIQEAIDNLGVNPEGYNVDISFTQETLFSQHWDLLLDGAAVLTGPKKFTKKIVALTMVCKKTVFYTSSMAFRVALNGITVIDEEAAKFDVGETFSANIDVSAFDNSTLEIDARWYAK